MEIENIVSEVEEVVELPEPVVAEPVAEVAEPVIEEAPARKPFKKKEDTVAVFSPKKATKPGLPDLNAGINNISKEDAEAWMAAKSYVKLHEETAN